ncbi:hypothetical protein AALO_G00308590 [Alosa alosa]|uniref:Uncharacterized protein n=1 Tax=Alosa alosa TaxID=278164 RepID=A0AAV6FCJ1_9TELE|nr:hypothetical protein AALO_G00308590 [Alosa alosa]
MEAPSSTLPLTPHEILQNSPPLSVLAIKPGVCSHPHHRLTTHTVCASYQSDITCVLLSLTYIGCGFHIQKLKLTRAIELNFAVL